MKRLLFFIFLLPDCAIAQIEVVNESMRCDSNSNVLAIGKFNYLQFKKLPENAIVSLSDGIIKSDPKIKGRYYIPGQKTMEGKSVNLKVSVGGKSIFNKAYKFYKLFNNNNGEGYVPIRFGDKEFANTILNIRRDSAIKDPQFYSMSEEFKIEAISFAFFGKRIDGDNFKINDTKFNDVGMGYLKKNWYNGIWIEIYVRLKDGNCYVYDNLIIRLID